MRYPKQRAAGPCTNRLCCLQSPKQGHAALCGVLLPQGSRARRPLNLLDHQEAGALIEKKGTSIVRGTLLLTAANLLLRLAAMSFQVYLSGRIGAAGIGLLQLILSVKAMSFTMGSAGIRTCAMYLSAEEFGRGRPHGIHAVLSGCFQYSLVCSILVLFSLWQLAPWLAENWIGGSAATPSLRVCALILPICCLYGVMTGYFTAAGRIRELVGVEFLEQACAMAATFLLLSRWAGSDTGRACLSVILGGGASVLVSFRALRFLHQGALPPPPETRRPPYRRILRIALPLAVADDLRAGLNTIENLIVPKRLARFAGTADALADYGVLHGMVFPVLMFPAAILFSLAELLVPEFSRCAAGKRMPRIRYLARRGLRVSLLFSLCAAGLLFIGADALGERLYHSAEAGRALRLYAPLVPLLYTDAIVDAICKGLGQQNANARYNLLTSFLDVALLWLLLPRYGLNGYYFSFSVTHLVNFCLSLRRLLLISGARPEIGLSLRAILCAGAAGWTSSLLPAWGGLWGVILSGAWYLLTLALLWTFFRVVRWRDFLWIRGLARQSGKGRRGRQN